MAYDDVYSEEDRRRALTQGLLGAGLAMLGARKGSEFNAFGQAGLLGLGGYNTALRDATNAREEQAMRKMREQQFAMQRAQWEQAQAEREGMRQAHQAAIIPSVPGGEAEPREGGMTPGLPGWFNDAAYINALRTNPNIDPAKALAYQQLIAKDTAFDKPKPEHWTPASLAEYARTRNPASLVPVTNPEASAVGKINPSDFTPASVAAFLSGGGKNYQLLVPVDKRPVSNVSIKNVAETEEDKTIGKGRGEAFVAINAGATKARHKITSLAAIESLVGDVETSPLTPIGLKVSGVLKGAMGIDIDPSLPRKQAAETIMNRLALEARSTADGGGMPGAMSDADREFLRNMNPTLSQTKEGRSLIVKVQSRLAKREQDLAQWAREYRAQRGRFDEGFQDYAAEKAAQSPLFSDLNLGQTSRGFTYLGTVK
jgi:hypothetical protein